MQNAILTSYNVSMWSAQRQDKKMTAEAKRALAVGEKAGIWKKNRVDTSHPEWRAICKARDYGRAIGYRYTLPWQDGVRLISPLALDEYQEAMFDAEAAFKSAVRVYCDNREFHINEARLACGPFFNEADYVELNENAFKFSVTFQPIPHDGHFDQLAELVGNEQAAKMAADLADRQQRQWQDATRHVWSQLHTALNHAADQLHHGQRIHDSVLGNLKELCDVLPLLNVTDDSDLENARVELSALFRSFSTESVKDKENRKSCADQVSAILAKLPT